MIPYTKHYINRLSLSVEGEGEEGSKEEYTNYQGTELELQL
jgi:hypothetical protein